MTRTLLHLDEDLVSSVDRLLTRRGSYTALSPKADDQNYQSRSDYLRVCVRSYLDSGVVDRSPRDSDDTIAIGCTIDPFTQLLWRNAVRMGIAGSMSELVIRAVRRSLAWEAYRESLAQRRWWELRSLSDDDMAQLLKSRSLVAVINGRCSNG